jgi:hypothetical protein
MTEHGARHLPAQAASAGVGPGRLVRRGEDGFAVYAVDASYPSRAHQPLWVVVDQQGQVLEMAKSELIAIAKMQALTLSRLGASICPTMPLAAEPQQAFG